MISHHIQVCPKFEMGWNQTQPKNLQVDWVGLDSKLHLARWNWIEVVLDRMQNHKRKPNGYKKGQPDMT